MILVADAHCHLISSGAEKTADQLITEALAEGIDPIINVCCEAREIPSLEKVSSSYERVYHTAGVHPHEASQMSTSDLDSLRAAAAHPKCRAIGEIGLDYYYDHSPRETQIQRLREQLLLALEVDLPVVIHARDAEEDLARELTDYSQRLPRGKIPGVIHCFTGTREFGETCLALGFYISFSGILTFRNAVELQNCARSFPLERLMVETDSPFLAPVPYRGKKCEPKMVRMTATKLAELRGIQLEEAARVTRVNTLRVFGLDNE